MAAMVEIYIWRACPFCVRAKALLDRKGVAYTEYAIDGDERARAAMAPAKPMASEAGAVTASKSSTVPKDW